MADVTSSQRSPGFWLDEIACEKRVFVSVARAILVDDAVIIDPHFAPKPFNVRRFGHRRVKPASQMPPVKTSRALGKRRISSMGAVSRSAELLSTTRSALLAENLVNRAAENNDPIRRRHLFWRRRKTSFERRGEKLSDRTEHHGEKTAKRRAPQAGGPI